MGSRTLLQTILRLCLSFFLSLFFFFSSLLSSSLSLFSFFAFLSLTYTAPIMLLFLYLIIV